MRNGRPQETAKRAYGRRAVLALCAAGAGGAILAACGADQSPTAAPAAAPTAIRPTTGTGATAPAAAATTAPAAAPTAAPTGTPAAMAGGAAMATPDANGKIPGGAPGVPDAYLKPPTPYKSVAMLPGKGGKVSAFIIAYLPPPTPRAQNAYWKEFEKRLGVGELDMTFAPQANYVEKVSTTVASGTIPDLFFLDLTRVPDQYRTIQQGAFTDLTSELSGEGLKQYPNLAQFAPQVWKNSAVGGKIYGVPRPRALAQNTLLYRQDWADKLGLARPKNGDDFLKAMEALTKNDPDGNGKADTFAMTSKPDGTGIYNLDFFSGMFHLPTGPLMGWTKNADGTLTAAIELPEFKEMVAYMRRLFEAGIFHPDTATMTTTQAQDAFSTGKVATLWDSVQSVGGLAPGLRGRVKQGNPQGNAVGLLPVGHDGKAASITTDTGFFGITAIPAKVGRDRERVKELLRIMDYYAAPFGSEERTFLTYGIEGAHHTLKDGERVLTDLGKSEIAELNNQSNNVPTYYYPGATQDATLMQTLQRDLLAIAVENPTNGLVSPTNTMKAAELRQLRIDRLNQIVQGRDPLSAVDTYVKDWRSRGGDTIRKEFEAALKGQ